MAPDTPPVCEERLPKEEALAPCSESMSSRYFVKLSSSICACRPSAWAEASSITLRAEASESFTLVIWDWMLEKMAGSCTTVSLMPWRSGCMLLRQATMASAASSWAAAVSMKERLSPLTTVRSLTMDARTGARLLVVAAMASLVLLAMRIMWVMFGREATRSRVALMARSTSPALSCPRNSSTSLFSERRRLGRLLTPVRLTALSRSVVNLSIAATRSDDLGSRAREPAASCWASVAEAEACAEVGRLLYHVSRCCTAGSPDVVFLNLASDVSTPSMAEATWFATDSVRSVAEPRACRSALRDVSPTAMICSRLPLTATTLESTVPTTAEMLSSEVSREEMLPRMERMPSAVSPTLSITQMVLRMMRRGEDCRCTVSLIRPMAGTTTSAVRSMAYDSAEE
mmetsp:Transcript_15108/g.56980  ORF Transcript_15108/g.56980 Transcript_15108/m.56980 type:complete len:401 (+) Transcript_15108:721-1923(+)